MSGDVLAVLVPIAVILYIVFTFLTLRTLYQKNILSYWGKQVANKVTNMGCLAGVLFGWWGILLAVFALFALAPYYLPILWLVAPRLSPRITCPACKSNIPGDVSRCPHCTAQVSPVV